MISIEVCLSPELISKHDLTGKTAIIVDILRATSCITAGLGSGISKIVPFESVDECIMMRDKGYILAGERGGEKLDNFDIGNSPFEYMDPALKGKKIAVTTTNGTKAIKLSEGAKYIVIGSFLNLSSIVKFILSTKKDVVVVCAGWRGKVNLEDSLFAGALIAELAWQAVPSDDAALLCKSSFMMVQDQLKEIISKSEHAKRLKSFNVIDDIQFCCEIDKFNIIPIYKNGTITSS